MDKSNSISYDYEYRGFQISIMESLRAKPDERFRVLLISSYSRRVYRPSKRFASESDAKYYAEMYAETHQ